VQEVDRLGWVVTVPLRAGNYVLGVRANTSAVGDLVRDVFADRVVEEANPPGNISVLLAPVAAEGPQELHRVYLTYARMLRTRSVRRVLEAMWHFLDAYDRQAAADSLQVVATVFLAGGRAHLLPADERKQLVDEERQWNREGFVLVDRAALGLDLDDMTVTIPECGLEWTDEMNARVAALGLDDRPAGVRSKPGTYPIASWTAAANARTVAARVVNAGGQVVDLPDHGGVRLVRRLAEVLRDMPQSSRMIHDPVTFRSDIET